MTMHEVLINAGYNDDGYCTMCNNQAKLYSKKIRGKTSTVKVRNDQRKFLVYYAGEKWDGRWQSFITIEQMLQDCLTNNNLV